MIKRFKCFDSELDAYNTKRRRCVFRSRSLGILCRNCATIHRPTQRPLKGYTTRFLFEFPLSLDRQWAAGVIKRHNVMPAQYNLTQPQARTFTIIKWRRSCLIQHMYRTDTHNQVIIITGCINWRFQEAPEIILMIIQLMTTTTTHRRRG